MSDKDKILDALKIMLSKEGFSKIENHANEDNVSLSVNEYNESEALTDAQALALGVSSLKEVQKQLTKKEQWAIKSMISYVSFKQKMNEETVRSILLAHLDEEAMISIAPHKYDMAIYFLVDFDKAKIIN